MKGSLCCANATTKGHHKLLCGLGGLIYLFMKDKIARFYRCSSEIFGVIGL